MALEQEVPALEGEESKESLHLAVRFWGVAALSLPVLYLNMVYTSVPYGNWVQWFCTTLVLFVVGWSITKKAIFSFLTGHLNMFSLIGFGVATAYFYSIALLWLGPISRLLYFEAATVIYTLVLLG
ncbi:hypothetical protein PHSC3_001528 [Chlamydiales bacterium STE3]|nr:hypothetical protein PHSC3_001528 [Chlamydiales bacterium STE3]